MNEKLKISARDYLRHAIATLAYRGGKVLRGAPPGFGSFKVGDTSRTPSEILAHVCDLFDWAVSLVRGREAWRDSLPGLWDNDVHRFFGALGAVDELLAEPGSLRCPWPRPFQGPIADALTHVGQLALLRRLAGSAVGARTTSRQKLFQGRWAKIKRLHGGSLSSES